MSIDYELLDIDALLEAKKAGRLANEFSDTTTDQVALGVGNYFLKLLEMEKTTTVAGLSARDIKRKEFHTNY